MTEDTEGYSFGEELVPVREGHTPRSVQGPYTFWDDERQTYVLAWGAGAFPHAVGFALADWADSLLKAVEAIRADPAKLADAGFVRRSLHDGRQLRQAIEAVEDELLRAARAARRCCRGARSAASSACTTPPSWSATPGCSPARAPPAAAG